MNKRRLRAIQYMNVIIIILLLLTLASLTTVICIELFCYKDAESTSVMLTKEEMANRPLHKSSVVTEQAEQTIGKSEEVEVEFEVIEVEKVFSAYEEIPLDDDIQIFMQKICDKYHVNFAFALAIMESESGMNVDTESGDSGKSIGAMQINKPNWYRYGLDAHNTLDNIEIGVRMLSELIEKYQEFDMTVMAYKGGEGFAESWQKQGKRLEACDTVLDRTMFWQEITAK